jgi:hypothetical protein
MAKWVIDGLSIENLAWQIAFFLTKQTPDNPVNNVFTIYKNDLFYAQN